MQFFKTKMPSRLVGLIAIAATGCQSEALIPIAPAAPIQAISSGTACQKADAMWNDKILPSRYAQLPPLTSPGMMGLLKLMTGSFSEQALTSHGDELEPGRHKIIHAFGAEARMHFVVSPKARPGYTGIFQSGAPCAIARFSLASKPDTNTSIPGLALKIFIDGDRASVNLLMMHSVDSQVGHNYFAQEFSNILPPAVALPKRLLARGFEHGAELFGAKGTNPGRLTLEHLASTLPDGERIAAPSVPYQLIFKPTAYARSLMANATAADDFRVKLAGLSVGQAIYDIHTLKAGDPTGNTVFLGQLVLAAPIVSSRYGDETLYFQHNMARN